MILSAYVNSHFISVVLFETDEFKVEKRAHIKIPLEYDPFFDVVSISQINNLIMKKLKIKEDDFDTCTKLITTDRESSDTAYGYTRHFYIKEVVDAVSGRIAFYDFYNSESIFSNNRDLLNRYLNQKTYRTNIDPELSKLIINKISDNYLKTYSHPKENVLEVIVSLPEYDEKEQDVVIEKVIEGFAMASFQNKIFEFTFDFGSFLLPIVAALIDRKEDPRDFFKTNPIHIDSKLITIPGLEEKVNITVNKNPVEFATRESGIKYLEYPDDTDVSIDSSDEKRKVHLEIQGARKGVYIDTRLKNDQ